MTMILVAVVFAMSLAIAGGVSLMLLEGLFRAIGASSISHKAPMGD